MATQSAYRRMLNDYATASVPLSDTDTDTPMPQASPTIDDKFNAYDRWRQNLAHSQVGPDGKITIRK